MPGESYRLSVPGGGSRDVGDRFHRQVRGVSAFECARGRQGGC